MNEDLISRQVAIDALGKDPKYKVRIFKTYKQGRSDQWFDDMAKISALPSAQPIIRCKDCKYLDEERDWRGEKYMTCSISPLPSVRKADGFCSYAERREE